MSRFAALNPAAIEILLLALKFYLNSEEKEKRSNRVFKMSVYPPTPSMPMMHGMEKRLKAKRPENQGSRELNKQENEALFSLVGPDAVSLTAAVVQLLKSDRGSWVIDIPHGVISLVKDYAQRAYFLRIFDILDERILWDFKLYKGFRAQSFSKCAKLLAFEQKENGIDGVVIGLNFYSSIETADFKEHLDRRHAQERKSTTNGMSRGGPPTMIMPTGKSGFFSLEIGGCSWRSN